MPVYRRADLSRAVKLVVALLLTAVSTGALAREFLTADIQSEDDPVAQAPSSMAAPIAERSDPAAARLIARIRKVE